MTLIMLYDIMLYYTNIMLYRISLYVYIYIYIYCYLVIYLFISFSVAGVGFRPVGGLDREGREAQGAVHGRHLSYIYIYI